MSLTDAYHAKVVASGKWLQDLYSMLKVYMVLLGDAVVELSLSTLMWLHLSDMCAHAEHAAVKSHGYMHM